MADTARLKALQNLSSSLPIANQKVAAGQSAARQMQVQQAVKQAPVGANIPQAAQQTGQAVAENVGQQAVQAAGQNLQQQQQVGQVGLQEQQTQNRATGASLQQGVQEQQMDNVQKLAQLDSKLKQDIYDRNMTFQKDELGRTALNENQMADYARLSATSDEQFKNYQQQANQASQRQLALMDTAYKKIIEDLDFRYQKAKQAGDQQTMRDVETMRTQTAARMDREKARAANSAAAWAAGGMILGGVTGAAMGQTAASTGAGAGFGGAAASAISGMGL